MTFEPETALVKCSTSHGDVAMELYREWSPNGFDRAVSLYEQGFYNHSHFYRVIPGFLVQFGISYTKDKALQALADEPINDDPVMEHTIEFEEGTISFAANSEHGRTTQLFISQADLGIGTKKWEIPIGKVINGMSVIKSLVGYGDIAPFGSGPDPELIRSKGKQYVDHNYPRLGYMKSCTVERRGGFSFQQDSSPQLQPLGDKFAVDMQPNPEHLAFFGAVAVLFFALGFLSAKAKAEDSDKVLIDMSVDQNACNHVKFNSTKKQQRKKLKKSKDQ